MSDHDGIAKRGRALEEEYFRRKGRELIEKIRQSAAADQARKDLGRKAGRVPIRTVGLPRRANVNQPPGRTVIHYIRA
jgi:hypothetical protein